MAGTRFLISGMILFLILRTQRIAVPAPRLWRNAALPGALLLLGGNGAVVWAQQTVPSGLTALVLGTTPLWMVLLGWLWLKEKRPSLRVVAGLVMGFAGLALLIRPSRMEGTVDLHGAMLLIFATLSWAVGSMSTRKLAQPASPFMASAMQMICGGIMLLTVGLVSGEAGRFEIASVTGQSVAALAYLTLVGSLLGFSAYIYVLKHSTPALASTYAYVNPVVAVILGWAVASEPVTSRTLVAAAVIIAAVILITFPGARSKTAKSEVGQLTKAQGHD